MGFGNPTKLVLSICIYTFLCSETLHTCQFCGRYTVGGVKVC